jgi:tripeptidyl-peptidase-1
MASMLRTARTKEVMVCQAILVIISLNCSLDTTDPTQDGIYSSDNCGKFAATKVISTSYGYNEADLTPFYEQRQCNEYMKLGLLGVSVLYSSGDYGVSGNGGQCIAPDGSYQNQTLGGRFNPSFPSTCPYVTSVGATQVIPGTNILTSRTQPEQACETV